MLIGQVIGTVVASRKHERLVGSKIQIVQPLAPGSGKAEGAPFVAVDAVGAGVGEPRPYIYWPVDWLRRDWILARAIFSSFSRAKGARLCDV